MSQPYYDSDLTDEDWQQIEPLLPPEKWVGKLREGRLPWNSLAGGNCHPKLCSQSKHRFTLQFSTVALGNNLIADG